MAIDVDLLKGLAAEGYHPSRMPGPRDGEIASQMVRIDSASVFTELLPEIDLGVARVLRSFAWRMATVAVRRSDAVWIRYGLIAVQLAMAVDGDPRDVLPTYSLLYRAAELLGVDASALFCELSYPIPGSGRVTLEEYAHRSPENRTIEGMGYVESSDKDGFVFRSVRYW